jgi:hypothetical protein
VLVGFQSRHGDRADGLGDYRSDHRESGRFNLAQVVLGATTGVAAAISTGAARLIVDRFGDFAGFMSMTIAVLGGVLLWLLVPETKPSKYID